MAHTTRSLALGLIAELNQIANRGLDPVYANWGEAMCDMWPSLHWDEPNLVLDILAILDDPRIGWLHTRIAQRVPDADLIATLWDGLRPMDDELLDQ